MRKKNRLPILNRFSCKLALVLFCGLTSMGTAFLPSNLKLSPTLFLPNPSPPHLTFGDRKIVQAIFPEKPSHKTLSQDLASSYRLLRAIAISA